MFQEELDLRDYLHVIKKRRRMIIIIFVVVVGSIMIRTLWQIPVYRATACIQIETETPKVLTFQEVLAEDTTDTEYHQTQYKLLKSHTLAKQVVQKLGMLDQAEQEEPQPKSFSIPKLISGTLEFLALREPPPVSEAAKAAARERQIIKDFLEKITISPIKGSRLVDVNVTSTSREETALIANTLAEMYIERQLEIKLSASREAVRWLEKEVETAWKKVEDSEVALQAYKERHAIISFEGRQNIDIQKLSQLNTAVNDAKVRRITIEAEYNRIQKYLKPDIEEWEVEELESIPQVISNPLVRQLKLELSSLESELSELQKKFRDKHPNVIALQSQITSGRDRIDAEIKKIFGSINKQYRVALEQELKLVEALEQQKREALELDQKAVMYEALQREVESNRRIYDVLLQRAKEASVTERLKTSNIRIVERAVVPNIPIAPRKARSIFLAMVTSLIIGIILTLSLEYFDSTIRTPKDIDQYLDIPCLGIIPKVSPKGVKGVIPHDEEKSAIDVIVATIVVVAPKTMVSEAYRNLRTNVMGSSSEQGSVLLITSAGPGEGKSGLVANLGIALALSGRKTLIIDCDFRKPIMHKIFCLKNSEEGFSDIIKNAETPGTKRLIQRTDIQNLSVMPCGGIPPNPSELLESTFTRRHIETLGKEYDKILIDSPPVNMVTDPVILSRIAHKVILVICAGKTSRDVAQCARDQLRDVDTKIIGGVLNNVDIRKDDYYYGYHFAHYYK